jgi:hypothetical protein
LFIPIEGVTPRFVALATGSNELNVFRCLFGGTLAASLTALQSAITTTIRLKTEWKYPEPNRIIFYI